LARRRHTEAVYPLTDTQRRVAIGVMVSGQPFELVIGVAGSGRSTALQAVRGGFEFASYRVLGAATSGQAARNPGEGAGIDSRTVASLTWRLDHGAITLDKRDVVVLKEGTMTSDMDIARLLGAVAAAGRGWSWSATTANSALSAPAGPSPPSASGTRSEPWTLTENLRQTNPAKPPLSPTYGPGACPPRSVGARGKGASTPSPTAGQQRSERWGPAADVAAGRDSLLLAYRRDKVVALNHLARDLIERAGGLTGPELVAPGGRHYRAGDRIIAVAPGPNGAWVRSQTTQVTAVGLETVAMKARNRRWPYLPPRGRGRWGGPAAPRVCHDRPPVPRSHHRHWPRPRWRGSLAVDT
jgi:hypothetical protein